MHVRLRRWVNSDTTFNILVGVLYIAIISAFTYLQVREDNKKYDVCAPKEGTTK